MSNVKERKTIIERATATMWDTVIGIKRTFTTQTPKRTGTTV